MVNCARASGTAVRALFRRRSSGLRLRALVAALAALALLLSGCAYPKEQRAEQKVALREHLLIVQNAVDQYKQKTGVLPIRTTTMDTPVYEKYPLDFRRLKEQGYLSSIPVSAFENGGSVIYVLVTPEERPTVRVMDLLSYQKTNDLQQTIDAFRRANSGALPAGEQVGDAFYRIDYDRLGRKAEQVQSPYSPMQLGFILHRSGQVAIDYAPELAQLIARQGSTPPADADLRPLLHAETAYVPVKSFPYYWRDNEPRISE